MSKKLLVVVILFFTFLLRGQEQVFNNFGNYNYLPSTECYNVTQDHKGYIWFSTEAGLCKYNGSEIKLYGEGQGLPENACYGICEVNKRLYIITSKNRLLVYNDTTDSFIEPRVSKKLTELLKREGTEQLYFIKTINDSTIALCSQWISFIIDLKKGAIERKNAKDFDKYYFERYNKVLFPIKYKPSSYKSEPLIKHHKLSISINHNNNYTGSVEWKDAQVPQWLCNTAVDKDNNCFISWNNCLIKITPEGKHYVRVVQNNILTLYIDHDNDLWVGTLKGGVLYFKGCNIEKDPVVSLSGISVTGICLDNEDGVWCSSLEKGMLYSKEKNIISYQNLYEVDKSETLLKVINDKLFCHINNKMVLSIGKEKSEIHSFRLDGGFAMSDIIPYRNGYLFSSTQRIGYADKDFKKIKYFIEKGNNYYPGASRIAVSPDNKVYFLQRGALMELTNDEGVVFRNRNLPSISNCLLVLDNYILLGCKDGLYKVDKIKYACEKVCEVNISVTDIVMQNRSIYISCKNGGIYKYENNTCVEAVSAKKMKGITVFDLCIQDDNIIWAATNYGAIKFDVKQNFKHKIVSNLQGLPSNQINKINYLNGFIYVATSEGVCSFEDKQFKIDTVSPVIKLKQVILDKAVLKKTNNYVLPNNYKEFSLKYDNLTYKDQTKQRIFYRIYDAEGYIYIEDTLKGNIIDLLGLPPGYYTLKVKSLNAVNIPSMEFEVTLIEVKKAYYQHWWFIAFVVLLIGLVLFLLIRFIINRIKKKEEEKTRINKLIAEYQLSALQAQMNPHFVFNAINSIQGYILNKDEQHAYDYLAKFSKLIRMVLNYSLEKTVVLKNEIEMLELYLELEQLRFENSFKYELQIDKDVSLYEFQIPTMLIQPYVENAIWHGLMNLPKDKLGVLKLSIKYSDDNLFITIEDNGIGREAAKSFSKSNHNSIGMKLTEQRIMMLNQLQNFEKAKVIVSDLYNEGIACGTKVEIIIPLA